MSPDRDDNERRAVQATTADAWLFGCAQLMWSSDDDG